MTGLCTIKRAAGHLPCLTEKTAGWLDDWLTDHLYVLCPPDWFASGWSPEPGLKLNLKSAQQTGTSQWQWQGSHDYTEAEAENKMPRLRDSDSRLSIWSRHYVAKGRLLQRDGAGDGNGDCREDVCKLRRVGDTFMWNWWWLKAASDGKARHS